MNKTTNGIQNAEDNSSNSKDWSINTEWSITASDKGTGGAHRDGFNGFVTADPKL